MEFEEFIAVGVVELEGEKEEEEEDVVGIFGAPKLDSGILGLSLIVFVFDEDSMIF